jgi:CRISPR-associated protein (TIGR02584 family)
MNKLRIPTLDFPVKRILVCVTGLSPQIVTETLYALATSQQLPWVPDEIRIITTMRGAENARLMLLSDNPGWFHRLCQDWRLPKISFDTSHIDILKGKDGQPLNDIRDDADNLCAADGIADLVRRLTEDDNTEIHASIAGGRKTMGFFLGYAMSLWGRPQDRLSHVLVSHPFESRPEFFYPSPTPSVIAARTPAEDPLDASTAKVWLGDIPFVRLRSLLPTGLKDHPSGFAQAVAAANLALDDITLVIDQGQCKVHINQVTVRLPPMQIAFLSLLAWRCQQKLGPLPAPSKDANDPVWKQMAFKELNRALGEMYLPKSINDRLNDERPIGDTFSEQISKLERTLRDSGALTLHGLIARQNIGTRSRQQGYSLNLRPERVQLIKPTR